MASFPVIFARPASVSLREHMPNVVSIILDQAVTLLTRAHEPLLHVDRGTKHSPGHVYVIIRMGEPHLFGVTVWVSRAPRHVDYAMRVLAVHCGVVAALGAL
jgi:hypothetical protein